MKKLLLLIAAFFSACASPGPNAPATQTAGGDQAFKLQHDRYVVEFLRRNPTVNTYLGGAGLDPSLREADGRLRDHSAAALEEEDRWLSESRRAFESIDAGTLSPARRIDRDVALAQINFQLHLHRQRRYQQRALDTYVSEPFRAIDWQLQGMTQTGEKTYGTAEEWETVVERLRSIPRYLAVAQEQIAAGIKSGNTPDRRMILRDGLNTSRANAKYFAETLPQLAAERMQPGAAPSPTPGHAADSEHVVPGPKPAEVPAAPGQKPTTEGAASADAGRPQPDPLRRALEEAARQAADAYRNFEKFIQDNFVETAPGAAQPAVKQQFAADRYALGEAEYDWAIRNNLRLSKSTAQLYEESWPVVERTRGEMVELARRIGQQRNLRLPAEGPAAVRAVFDELSKDYPKSDAEMLEWYKQTGARLVEYGRKSGVFDVPADYKLEVVETPPPLRASIDGAAYYPAPPFKNSGVGRFYLTTTGNDLAALKSNNRASVADLAAHEGFPGHDWHYKVMTQYRDEIAPVRWLTPGAVEDSSSMWEDSMASEGWALYSEALMAEPQPGFPEGFYTPEERLYQLQGKLYRDLRVRIDTGIHTGRMSYDDAVDLFSEVVDFLPGKCGDPAKSDAKRVSCESSERAIFRYSKWPTQAITYRLGKEEIFALRDEAARAAGANFSPKDFHVRFMRQGTIPAGYFREELLRAVREKK